MKTAEDMFDELDFIKTLENDSFLAYERYVECRNNFYSELVIFRLKDKTLSLINIDEISLYLLQAINKQVEELGWLDE